MPCVKYSKTDENSFALAWSVPFFGENYNTNSNTVTVMFITTTTNEQLR